VLESISVKERDCFRVQKRRATFSSTGKETVSQLCRVFVGEERVNGGAAILQRPYRYKEP